MNMKRLGTALVVVLACGAIAVSSASAAAVTEDQTWTIEGVTLSGTQSVSSTGSGTLVTKVGATPLELTATGINCLSCSIYNEGSAEGHAELELFGVTVKTPAVCAVSGRTIRTEWLRIKADYMIGTSNYILFEPVLAPTIARITLVKGTGSCPISGSYRVTGEVFVKSVNGTGVDEVNQKVESSEAINKEASGKTEPLQFGGVAAVLNGSASFALSVTNVGKKFGTR